LALKEKLTEFRDYTASIAADSESRDSVNQNPNTDILQKNSEKSPNISEIIANMERWRWLPSDLGDDRIEVNLPEYTARVIRNGQLVHETRVIIGKQSTPTPLFSNKMVHLIVNPSWHVPASIVNKEILPKLAEDPEYAVRNGYEITELDSGKVSIRQPPGGGNALGFVKFMFPNEHAVYLHDTPSRKLFANFERAYSHGCVRVENPFELAAILLDRPEYSEPRLKAMIGKGERLIRLKEPLPIHITYFTLSVDESGAIRKLADVYGYDKSVAYALRKQPSKAVAALRRTVE
jgi:murein L,D-transpeptidase YcbB/YkuD